MEGVEHAHRRGHAVQARGREAQLARGHQRRLVEAVAGTLLELERSEGRFRQVEQEDPERFRTLVEAAQADIKRRWDMYEHLARAMTPADS